MAVKIRLMRIGAKGRPFYRVVAVDERKKRTGSYLELLGTYNPLTTPKEINLKQDRIDAWVKNGAQMSTGFLRVIGKAPQRQARKPKKDKGGSAAPAAPQPAEATAESSEAPAEASVEEVKAETPEVASEQVVEEATGAEEPKVEETPAEVTEQPQTEESTEVAEAPKADEVAENTEEKAA